MKYLLTYLFTILLIGCLGQRPVPYFTHDKKAPKRDTISLEGPLYVPIQYDSSKYYWKQFTKYHDKMNVLIDKMNERQDPEFDKRIFAFEDSCKKYKELIEKYKP